MDLRIRSVILWPKDRSKQIRAIDFYPDRVNVITGGSERGKSAIVAIVDYCLGSGTCRIPIKRIREMTEWFGVLFTYNDATEILIARKEPGQDAVSNNVYFKQGTSLNIPSVVEENCNVIDLKKQLNILAGLPENVNLEIQNNLEANPSFRDLTSFLFQPQYIIANQSTLFYRADLLEQRQKLKNIFKFILKAVDIDYLEKESELKEIDRELNSLLRELERRKKHTEKWLGQLKGYYLQAKEFGLLKYAERPEDTWGNEDYIQVLRKIDEEVNQNLIPQANVENTLAISKRITDLTNKEIGTARNIQNLKHRQEIIANVLDGNSIYRKSLLNQHQRIEPLSWLEKNLKKKLNDCPFCGSKGVDIAPYINDMLETKRQIVQTGLRLNDNHTVLSSENSKLNRSISEQVKELNNIRAELQEIKQSNDAESKLLNTLNSIYLFAGKINAEINRYDNLSDETQLVEDIEELKKRKLKLEQQVNAEAIKNRLERAKSDINASIKHYAAIFKAENRDEKIEFNEKDLTINFIPQSGRKQALYEIGSGHNYMAYHFSLLLSLHEFFLKNQPHPVPSFIVFDQPTQVYYPEKTDKEDEDDDRVKLIFEALQSCIYRTEGKLQVIVLEHVGEHAWADHDKIIKLKRWRNGEQDSALILDDWLEH